MIICQRKGHLRRVAQGCDCDRHQIQETRRESREASQRRAGVVRDDSTDALIQQLVLGDRNKQEFDWEMFQQP